MRKSATEARESVAASSAQRVTAPCDKWINALPHSGKSVNCLPTLPEGPVAGQSVTAPRRLERTIALARHLLIIMALSPFWLMLAVIALSLQTLHDFRSAVFDGET
jgi:hypothetical protein